MKKDSFSIHNILTFIGLEDLNFEPSERGEYVDHFSFKKNIFISIFLQVIDYEKSVFLKKKRQKLQLTKMLKTTFTYSVIAWILLYLKT